MEDNERVNTVSVKGLLEIKTITNSLLDNLEGLASTYSCTDVTYSVNTLSCLVGYYTVDIEGNPAMQQELNRRLVPELRRYCGIHSEYPIVLDVYDNEGDP